MECHGWAGLSPRFSGGALWSPERLARAVVPSSVWFQLAAAHCGAEARDPQIACSSLTLRHKAHVIPLT